jgi:uncharacterized protein
MTLGMIGPAAEPQQTRHRVVFEFVNEGAEQMDSVLNNIENTLKALGPNTEIMVIAHGPGLALVRNTHTAGADRIKKLQSRRVGFAACENTLRKKNVSREELLPGVTTVDSGVAEVVRKQAAGWAYVKSGH